MKLYIYECHSSSCRGAIYGVTESPLSCPYCDKTAIEEIPKFETKIIKYDLYRGNS